MRIQEFTQDVFRHHGVIHLALNYHLLNHRVSLCVHEVVVKRIETLEAKVKEVRSEHHNLVDKFKAMKNRRAGRGGGRGDRSG